MTCSRWSRFADPASSAGPASAASVSSVQLSRTQHTEFVALGIGQHNPRLKALADVGLRSTEIEEPRDLLVLIVGPKVQVQTILGGLRIRNRNEYQARQAVLSWPNLDLFTVFRPVPPAQCVRPPSPEPMRIGAIDDDLFPFQRHRSSLGRVAVRPAARPSPPLGAGPEHRNRAATRSIDSDQLARAFALI